MLSKKRTAILLNSLSIAIIINAQFVAYVANVYLKISGGLVTILYLFSLALVICGALFTDLKIAFTLSKKSVFLAGYIMFAFVLSLIVASGSATKNYLSDFIATGIITLIIIQCNYDVEAVLFFNMAFGVLFCVSPGKYISSALLNISYERASMFASYILIPILLSALFHWLFFKKKSKICLLIYLADLYMLFRMISILGRGPLLSLLIGGIIAWILKRNEKWGARSTKNKVLMILILLVLVIVVSNFEHLLYAVNAMLNHFGIQVAALKKTIDLFSANGAVGILNSRNDRWEWAFTLIKRSPLIGNGIGEYANVYGTWPHNVVLQIVVELGIIGGIPIILCMFKNLRLLFFRAEKTDKVVFLGLLCSISIPRLMLSSYLWHHPEFWLFMYLGLQIAELAQNKKGKVLE